MTPIAQQPTTRHPAPGADATFIGRMSPPKGSKHDQLVRQTEKWVATSFYGELLKQARNGPFKDELFSGGSGGKTFQSLQDQQMSEQMARGAGRKLVNAIVRRIEATSAYAVQKRSGEAATDGFRNRLNAPRRVEPTPSSATGASSSEVRAHVPSHS